MRRHRAGIFVIAVLFSAAVVAGLVVARRFGPDQVMAEVERRLSRSLGATVSVDRLRVSPGTFVRVFGDGVTAWPTPDGHGLEIDQVLGSIDAFSLFGGPLELARLRLDGARLRLSALGSDDFRPVGSSTAADKPSASPGAPNPDELLAPLITLETVVRRVLLAPHAAAVLELRNARISFEDERTAERGMLELVDLEGQLVHHRFSQRSEFTAQGRVTEGGANRGVLRIDGRRNLDGSIGISVVVEALELATGTRYLRELRPQAEILGKLSGQWSYETPEPGTGRLKADLTCVDVVSSIPGVDAAQAVRSPRINFSGTLEINPQSATAHDFRIWNHDTSLHLNGEISRPLNAGSVAMLDLDLQNLDLGQARHLIGWLPAIEREEAAAVVAPLTDGRLQMLRAHGRSTLTGWQDLLAGRSRRVPAEFSMHVKLEDMVAEFGDANRLEQLAAELHWSGDRVEIHGATAVLNDRPLPVLDVTIDGFPNFLAGDPELRAMDSKAPPMFGLDTLWQALQPEPGTTTSRDTRVGLDIEYLEHPLFVWPLRDVTATIIAEPGIVHIDSEHAIWAGVPIELSADWHFEPGETVSVEMRASAPPITARIGPHAGSWARGRFSVGQILGGRWQQHEAHGNFVASEGRVRIRQLEIQMAPTGHAIADGLLDLSVQGEVPFRVSFGVVDGDGSAIAKLFGLPAQQIMGNMKLDGSFEGLVKPDTSFFAHLDGILDLTAENGAIRKVTPPVVAIAEAASDINTSDPSELVPFDRVESVMEFGDGRMHSSSFSLDGPKIGVVSSGELELAAPIKTIDAQVYVFLFRKLDRVLGKIPILNRMLLGTDENLVAAAFDVSGEWSNPKIEPILLPSSAGSTSQVLQGVPHFVMRGIRALGSLVKPSAPAEAEPPPSAPDPSPDASRAQDAS